MDKGQCFDPIKNFVKVTQFGHMYYDQMKIFGLKVLWTSNQVRSHMYPSQMIMFIPNQLLLSSNPVPSHLYPDQTTMFGLSEVR